MGQATLILRGYVEGLKIYREDVSDQLDELSAMIGVEEKALASIDANRFACQQRINKLTEQIDLKRRVFDSVTSACLMIETDINLTSGEDTSSKEEVS